MSKAWETDLRSGLDYELEAEGMCIASGEKDVIPTILAGGESSFKGRVNLYLYRWARMEVAQAYKAS